MSVWGKPVLTGVGPVGTSVTGNPAEVTGNGNPFANFSITLPITQEGSGTPSPTNIRPIVIWDDIPFLYFNKNAFDSSTNTIARGSISSSTGANNSSTTRLRTNSYMSITGGTEYYIGSNIYKVYVHYYDSSQTFLNGQSVGWNTLPTKVTAPSTAAYMRVVLAKDGDGTIQVSEFSYLNVAAIKKTVNHHLSAENFTVGTVDFAKGEAIRARVYIVLDGTEDWVYIPAGSGGAPYCRFELPELVWTANQTATNCSHFLGSSSVTSANKIISCRAQTGGDGKPYLNLRKSTSDTLSSVTEWLAEQYSAGTPVQVSYGIAEGLRHVEKITPYVISSGTGLQRIGSDINDVTVTLRGNGLRYIS